VNTNTEKGKASFVQEKANVLEQVNNKEEQTAVSKSHGTSFSVHDMSKTTKIVYSKRYILGLPFL